jgi:putative transposase
LTRPELSHASLLSELREADRVRALERFRVLRPCVEDGVALAKLARDHELRLRTLQRWLHAYRESGLIGLARKSRNDRGRRLVSAEFQQLIEGLALRRPPLSRAAVYREATATARAHGWRVPSYHTVYRVIQQLPAALVTLAHDGSKVYADRFELLYRREASRSNEIWQADHTPLDLWVLDERGRAARAWFTVVLDDYSRAVAGYALSLHAPSSIQTALALRQAIWRKGDAHWSVCGIPDTFYSDHGSDFTSHHMEQVAAELHMALVFSIVANRADAAKSSASSKPRTNSSSAISLGTRLLARLQAEPCSACPNLMFVCGRSWWKPISSGCTARLALLQHCAGKRAVSYPGCPTRPKNSICSC